MTTEKNKSADLEGDELEKARKRNEAEETKFRAKRRAETLEEMTAAAVAFGTTMRKELGLDAFSERYLVALEQQAHALTAIARELASSNARTAGSVRTGRTSPAPARVDDFGDDDEEPIASVEERSVIRRASPLISKHLLPRNPNRRRTR